MLKEKTISQNGTQKSNVSYAYDKLDRLQYVYENDILISTYTYDDNGNRTGLTYSNGNSTGYVYNLANKPTALTNKRNGVTISQYAYTYYLNGNQADKTDPSGTTSYTYDGLGRLSGETEPGSITITYSYDDYNNRSNKTVVDSINTTTYDYSYDVQCKLLTETKRINGVMDSTINYQYDNNGNMTSNGARTFKYDGFNQLMEVASGTNVYTYSYNGDGLRISKVINGTPTNYIWKGNNITLETDANGSATANYVLGINLIASDIGGTRKYYLFNGHGDVIQLTGTDGSVTRNYDYDAFGVEKNPDPNDTNMFRYCGEYFDKETGTIYLRARYYDPANSRMLTEDSYWGDIRDPLSLNLYTYCGNDPINRIDPSGNNWTDAVAGWAKSVDDSIFFGAAGWLGNKIRSVFGADENDWDYQKSNNPDFALAYQAGTYTNLIYGVVNLGSGLYKITTSGGEALLTSSGQIVEVTSGSAEGIIQSAKGAGISFMASRGIGGKGWQGDKTWKSNLNQVGEGGTIEKVNDVIPTQEEAIKLINESKGKVIRIEGPHPEGGVSPHTYPHINYETANGVKGTIRIQGVIE